MKLKRKCAKSISSALRQLLQKNGEKLANRTMGREDFVNEANKLVDMPRSDADRNWGDQDKDSNKKSNK